MDRAILVGIDGSKQAIAALEYAIELFPDASITAVSVVNPVAAVAGGETFDGSLFEQQQDLGEEYLQRAVEAAADHDREIDTELLIGTPARELITYAEDAGVDHIVVGSHGRTGLERMLLGSVAESVVRRAQVPVTVVR